MFGREMRPWSFFSLYFSGGKGRHNRPELQWHEVADVNNSHVEIFKGGIQFFNLRSNELKRCLCLHFIIFWNRIRPFEIDVHSQRPIYDMMYFNENTVTKSSGHVSLSVTFFSLCFIMCESKFVSLCLSSNVLIFFFLFCLWMHAQAFICCGMCTVYMCMFKRQKTVWWLFVYTHVSVCVRECESKGAFVCVFILCVCPKLLAWSLVL